jgi:hypothetical protein
MAQTKPIKTGFSMALTGSVAAAGKAALIAMKIWMEDVNARGGLLGRPVELVYYDDQSKPAQVPGIYTKLIAVDKVDFVVSPASTLLTAPAMPIVMEQKMVFPSLFALAVNTSFNYKYYFQIMPVGPEPYENWSKGFFAVAARRGEVDRLRDRRRGPGERARRRRGPRRQPSALPPLATPGAPRPLRAPPGDRSVSMRAVAGTIAPGEPLASESNAPTAYPRSRQKR